MILKSLLITILKTSKALDLAGYIFRKEAVCIEIALRLEFFN